MTGDNGIDFRRAAEKTADVFRNSELSVLSLLALLAAGLTGKRRRARQAAHAQKAYETYMRTHMAAAKAEASALALRELRRQYEDVARRLDAFLSEQESAETEPDALRREAEDYAQDAAAELETAWDAGLIHMRREADDVFRWIIEETRDDHPGDALRESAQDALNRFAAQGITGFEDAAGRRWGLAEYVDMAMRTALQRASLEATIRSMRRHGHDLCYVNAHLGACPLCAKWEGRVMSLSGADGYPTLRQAMDEGLFHPNCAHILQVYLPGVSRVGIGNDFPAEYSAEIYQARQKQRYIERQIRKYKRIQAAAFTPEAERKAQARVRRWQQAARENASFQVQRRYDREGGRVLLSEEAKRLKPLQLDENGRALVNEAKPGHIKNPLQSDVLSAIIPSENTEAGGDGVQFPKILAMFQSANAI